MRFALPLAALLVACAEDNPGSLTRNNPSQAGDAGPEGAEAIGPEGAFPYANDLALLPFDVRLAKVAKVVGVETTDPLLEPLRARRYDLGDHDYSKGVKPDTTWSSARLGTWVKALKPVCASPAMRTRYPALPEKLGELMLAAYGRNATDEDRKAVEEAVAATALDSESQYQVVCLAVLTSLEFVAR